MSEKHQDWIAVGRQVIDTEIAGLEAVRDALGPSFARAVAMLGECRGRVVVSGIGKSGLVGRKIAATFSSTGTPAFFLHPVEGAHGDLGSIRSDDMVLALSNSGRTEELNAVLPALRSLGAGVIAITGDEESPMARMADCVLYSGVPREACPMNLAPTASTTALLALGDALAVSLIRYKSFSPDDFKRFHPGGNLGQRLRVPVAAIMHTRNMPLAPVEASLGEALNILNAGGLGVVLFVDAQRKLVGLFTDGDLRRLVCRGALSPDRPAAEIMVANPCHGRQGQSVAELLDIMEGAAITVLPVTDENGLLLGVVHLHDLLGKGAVRFSEGAR